MLGFGLFQPVWGLDKNHPFKSVDNNYCYIINFIGHVNVFFDNPVNSNEASASNERKEKFVSKIVIELTIGSLYGGIDWLPMNPLITDDSNRLYPDYKVIIEPQSGNSKITMKYLVTPLRENVKSLTFFEEGESQDGKKAFRVLIKNIPL